MHPRSKFPYIGAIEYSKGQRSFSNFAQSLATTRCCTCTQMASVESLRTTLHMHTYTYMHVYTCVHACNFSIQYACTCTAAHAMLLCDNIPKVKGHSIIFRARGWYLATNDAVHACTCTHACTCMYVHVRMHVHACTCPNAQRWVSQ